DFKDLKVQNPNGILQAMEELTIELFEIKDGVDLGFIENTYAEKFHWDTKSNQAVPDEKFKKDVEDQVLLAYSKMSDINKAETFKEKMKLALKENKFQEAMIHVDSALFYNSNDATLLNNKAQIEASILKQAKDIEKRIEFDGLKEQGNVAYTSGDYIAAEGFYNDAVKLFGDNQIKYKLKKIEEYKVRISQLESNKEKLNRLRISADSLLSISEFDNAIGKLREIQFLDPNQRTKIQSEMKEIKKKKKNSNYENTIQKYIEIANRLENSKDSLDASLLFYERAESSISNLSDQILIDKFKIQVRDGIESVRVKKSKEREAFYQQLDKANSNFLKGPDFYDKAIKILDSDLMKPYRGEPEMIKLKNRILSMDQFYNLKKGAFTNYVKNSKMAISDLKKALKIGNDNFSVTPKTDLNEIRDSLQSWTGSTSLSSSSQSSTVSGYNNSGSVVRTPGIVHSGSDVDAYNDLALTMKRKKSDPLEDLQDVKNDIDYEVYFNNTVNAVRNEKSADEMKTFQNEIEIKEREVALQKIELQKEQDEERQNLESAVKSRNEYALFQQEASAEQIKKWNDEKDYLIELELLNQARRNQSFEEKNRIHENERILLLEENDIASEQRQYKSQDHLMKLDRDRFIKDSLEKLGGENRALEVEKLKSFKPEYATQPNFLKNEDGILFAPNAVTEGFFKIENSKGFVISVIVQRVVVDSNGYGVVYEKTTKENGSSYYSRNGAAITEYIWFNESMGQNVIEN
ncbi:MAG: hypothetical protein HOK92_09190, partial [Flavobacteriales bacterium]|nr:hypothetical protein [Flavobacteriales bacterium]